ncbi:MAG: hypothetical protein ACOYBJ_01825 [Patescibacteria group bacterium]|jgi:hypothetical protein
MALDNADKQWIAQQLTEQLRSQEDRIVARINREVTDLAEINRLALDRLENHEH